MALAQHLMLRLADSRVIAPTPEARCVLARAVLTIGRDFGLFAFRGADSHLHMGATCSEGDAGELGRRVELSLRRRLALPVPFAPAHRKPVNDQRHASTLLDYFFCQERHHGTDLDPLFVASNLPDLLGMRLLGDYTRESVALLLPRVSSRLLASFFELPLGEEQVWQLGDLSCAAADAFALTSLEGRTRQTTEARRAAVAALPGATVAELAAELTVTTRAVWRLRAEGAPPRAVRAVQLQLQLRAAWRQKRARREQASLLPHIGRC